MLQALLLAIWAGLCTWDQFGPHLGFRKPLLASVGVGIILGDMPTAIMIGATMELMWLGVNNIGAYVPPDVISGTIVGLPWASWVVATPPRPSLSPLPLASRPRPLFSS